MKYIVTIFFLFLCFSSSILGQVTHKIKAGETIESIAKKYGISTSDLLEANPKAKSFTFTGMELTIPGTETKKETHISTTSAKASTQTSFDDIHKSQGSNIGIGYYIEGSTTVLRQYGLITGSVFNPTFSVSAINEEIMKKVEKKTFTTLPLNGKQPKMLISHPQESYTFTITNGKFKLNIIDSELFWSTSNYIVIQTK